MGNFRIATWREEKASVQASILSAVDMDVICPAGLTSCSCDFFPGRECDPELGDKINHFSLKLLFVVLRYHSNSVETGESTP